MIRVGIIGDGNKVGTHISTLQKIPNFDVIGLYSQDKEIGYQLSIDNKIKLYDSPNELLNDIDAVDIATSNEFNYFIAQHAVKKSKHIFFSSPIKNSLEELKNIIKLANESDVKIQIEKINRFNSSLNKAKEFIHNPKLIEIQRNIAFNSKQDQSREAIIFMIQDIELIFEIYNIPIKRIQTTGVYNNSRFTNNMINVRIEFTNGSIASITNNFLTDKDLLHGTYYQENGTVNINFSKSTISLKLLQHDKVMSSKIEVVEEDHLEQELIEFVKSIESNTFNTLTNEDELQTLLVAYKILSKVEIIKENA